MALKSKGDKKRVASKRSISNAGFSTRAIHSGQSADQSTGALMTPIYQSSTFKQSAPGVYIGPYDYSRAANPTRTALEDNLAALENARYGIAFSSGCAAIDAVLHLLSSSDHVILCDDVYGGTYRLFDKVYKQFGISYSRVDMTDPRAYVEAFRPNTKLVMLESPTNPLLKIIDLEQCAEIARKRKALSVVDNTFASPYLQNPLNLGADIVVHSSTKYLGGHSDLIGGVTVTNNAEISERLHFIQKCIGAVPSPLECFMLLRSTKTLAVRMERHCSNAYQLAQYLQSHKRVKKVLYPGLKSHPGHLVAKRQMRDFGGMISVVLKADLKLTVSILKRLKLFCIAESLGGVESLVDHPAIMTHASIPPALRAKIGISDSLLRFSVGIEDISDLLSDLDYALL